MSNGTPSQRNATAVIAFGYNQPRQNTLLNDPLPCTITAALPASRAMAARLTGGMNRSRHRAGPNFQIATCPRKPRPRQASAARLMGRSAGAASSIVSWERSHGMPMSRRDRSGFRVSRCMRSADPFRASQAISPRIMARSPSLSWVALPYSTTGFMAWIRRSGGCAVGWCSTCRPRGAIRRRRATAPSWFRCPPGCGASPFPVRARRRRAIRISRSGGGGSRSGNGAARTGWGR